jgi:hypothetical protein
MARAAATLNAMPNQCGIWLDREIASPRLPIAHPFQFGNICLIVTN